jgi:guanylate kinase
MTIRKSLSSSRLPSGSGKDHDSTSFAGYLIPSWRLASVPVHACHDPMKRMVLIIIFFAREILLVKLPNHEFAEFEMVYEGKYYGTLKSELQKIWTNHGRTPLVDIDVQGALRLKKHYGARLP